MLKTTDLSQTPEERRERIKKYLKQDIGRATCNKQTKNRYYSDFRFVSGISEKNIDFIYRILVKRLIVG